jgi:hypothetical protein
VLMRDVLMGLSTASGALLLMWCAPRAYLVLYTPYIFAGHRLGICHSSQGAHLCAPTPFKRALRWRLTGHADLLRPCLHAPTPT